MRCFISENVDGPERGPLTVDQAVRAIRRRTGRDAGRVRGVLSRANGHAVFTPTRRAGHGVYVRIER